jgi:proline dehydrogenase
MRGAVSCFMLDETVKGALTAAALQEQKMGTVSTHLGENITDQAQAEQVARHYLDVIACVRESGLGTELSVNPTQLGPDLCYANLKQIIEHEKPKKVVWIDMETSNYVDAPLDLYHRARQEYPNVGLCLQSYLYRTARDLASLISLGAPIPLVKGAYKEPPNRPFPRKKDVDENFFALAKELVSGKAW